MEKYYKKLSLLLSENKNISKDDEELYGYAAKIFFQSVINTIITISIGIIMGMIKECLCFITVFIVMRKFAGGLHAKKYSYCLICSTILIIVSLYIIKILEKHNFQIEFWCLIVISVIVICIFAPIENNNKPLSLNEKKVYKFISIILSLVFLIIIYFFTFTNIVFSYCLGNGLIAVSFLIILSNLKKYIVGKDYDI